MEIISKYIKFTMRRYKLIVLLAMAVLVGSLAISSNLGFDSSLDGMLPEGNEVIDAMLIMEEEFGAQESVVIVVKTNGDSDTAIDFLDALAARINKENLASQLMYKIELDEGFTQYFQSDSGNLFLMTLIPNINMANIMDERDDFFAGLFDAVDETLQVSHFRNLEAGVTGGSFIQDYESAAALADGFILAGIVTLILIIGLLILTFKRIFLPLTTVLPLILGVVLTTAFATIAYGGINVFSISFAVLLMGMGIDYAIHVLSRYGEHRAQGESIEEALISTIEKTGLSMVIGSLTTALAFLGFLFARMKGFTQMGVISAIGIFLALISQLMVTPALIAWADGKKNKKPKKDMEFTFMLPVGKFISKYGISVLLIVVVLMGATFTNVKKTDVEGDASSLQPSDLSSLEWLEVVQGEFDYNPDEIMLMANDLNQLGSFVDRLNEMDSVASIDSITNYLPADKELWEEAISTLPSMITENYIGNTGKFLINVTATGDIWDNDFMEEFRNDLFSLTSYVTGIPILMNEFVSMMIGDIFSISIIAAIAILLVLLLMFRSFKYAIVTMIPIVSSLYILLGLMPLFNLQLNMLNIIALPLVIGIGVGGAVHVANRIKSTGDISKTLVHTGKAVILSSITTIFAFGSLIFSGYPGLTGLGLLVVLGLSISLILNLTLLPALLGLGLPKNQSALEETQDCA